MLGIRAGPNLKQFNIHSDLLAELSEEMKQFVYEDIEEGVKKEYVEMKEVSEETMTYFSEFCYTGGYNVHAWLEDQEKALAHARLYGFAKKYKIEAVQELAVGKLSEFIASHAVDKNTMIPCLVGCALENIPEETTTDTLIAFLARGTASMMPLSGGDGERIRSLLASVSRKDFFVTFCENTSFKGESGDSHGGFGVPHSSWP